MASVSACGLGAKNEEYEPKTARKMARVKEQGGGGEERFSKSRGLPASVSFPPLPLPSLLFFGSRFISRAAKTENPFLVLSILCSETKRKRLLRRLTTDQNCIEYLPLGVNYLVSLRNNMGRICSLLSLFVIAYLIFKRRQPFFIR